MLFNAQTCQDINKRIVRGDLQLSLPYLAWRLLCSYETMV